MGEDVAVKNIFPGKSLPTHQAVKHSLSSVGEDVVDKKTFMRKSFATL